MDILGVDIEINFLLNGFLSTLAQSGTFRSCRFSLEVGWEEGQPAALRLGDPGLCAGRMVVEDWLSAEECLGSLPEVLFKRLEVRKSRRRPDRGRCHFVGLLCFC